MSTVVRNAKSNFFLLFVKQSAYGLTQSWWIDAKGDHDVANRCLGCDGYIKKINNEAWLTFRAIPNASATCRELQVLFDKCDYRQYIDN